MSRFEITVEASADADLDRLFDDALRVASKLYAGVRCEVDQQGTFVKLVLAVRSPMTTSARHDLLEQLAQLPGVFAVSDGDDILLGGATDPW